jgi:replication-associated recombination protein RarA
MAGDLPPTPRGYEARQVVSALQKAIRRSDVHAALYWAYELDRAGLGNWLWKRLRIIAVEDVSPLALGLVADVKALNDEWKDAQRNRSDGHEILFVTRAVISLAIAPKSRIVDWAVWHHANDHVERLEIPDEALDGHTLAGRRMGRGEQFFIDEASRLVEFDDDLAEIEGEYRALAQRMVDKDPDQPHNPWRAPTPANPEQGDLFPTPNVGTAHS